MFSIITLDLKENLFNELLHSVEFEKVAKGRMGNHLVKKEEKGVPVVRTTTKYTIPAHHFSAIHFKLMATMPEQDFNNALIEVYDSSYTKMGFHSDQALDLAPDSYIGVFSCYEKPDEPGVRKLVVKDKVTEEEFSYAMTHHSLILFSIATNRRYLHKIVLEDAQNADNRWLGITFRKSKTYQTLELATPEQEKTFFQLRGQENNNLDFEYPELTYTISPADLLPPKSGDLII